MSHTETHAEHIDEEHDHPSDLKYVKIAIVLAAITAAEVVTFYVEDELGALLAPILIVMMIVKFGIVAAEFMHLRYDSNLLTRVFVAGIVLAVGVYIAAMTTFHYFSS